MWCVKFEKMKEKLEEINKEEPKVYVKSGQGEQIWTTCKCTKYLEDWTELSNGLLS